MRRVVVAGGGLAGIETVVALRDHGFDGEITLLGAERHLPYERPPLSKGVLIEGIDQVEIDADWEELDVDLRLGCSALRLDGVQVQTSGGAVPFDGLVLATGAAPIALPGTDGMPGVHTLRTIDDALAIRAACVPGARVVVVGAGWIGAEVATAAAHHGCSVTVVEAMQAPLAAALPRAIGERTIAWYSEAGVDLRLGMRVAAVDAGAVRLADGETLAADCIVVGIGVRPETGWLEGSGVALDEHGRVLADASLRTSRPGVVAAGDCAAWESARFATRLHVEHFDNAQRAPEVAAQVLLGQPATYDPVPYFWSECFGRMVQYAGHGNVADQLVTRDGSAGEGWAACWVREGRLMAILGVDRPRDVAQGRKLIEGAERVDPGRLADPGTALKDCLA